jgi:hypothetical protein
MKRADMARANRNALAKEMGGMQARPLDCRICVMALTVLYDCLILALTVLYVPCSLNRQEMKRADMARAKGDGRHAGPTLVYIQVDTRTCTRI